MDRHRTLPGWRPLGRALLLLLALCALAATPVRAGSLAFLHKPPPSAALAPVETVAVSAPCPLHQQMAGDHEGPAPAKPDHMTKGAAACCVAWCVSPALPVALTPLRFPPPSGFLPPVGLPGPEGRQDSPPLRPPRA